MMIDAFISALRRKYRKKSTNWKGWVAQIDDKTCKSCCDMHGKIFPMAAQPWPKPPLHLYCRCVIEALSSIVHGEATDLGRAGADYWLKTYHRLPDEYISKEDAKALGWIPEQGNLEQVAPNSKIGGNIYKNRNGHLPAIEGRIWYEADINYTGGFRGIHRILYSNDGLIFVTYDHYETFVEII